MPAPTEPWEEKQHWAGAEQGLDGEQAPPWEQSWFSPHLQLSLPVGATWLLRNVRRKGTQASAAPTPKLGGGVPGMQAPCPLSTPLGVSSASLTLALDPPWQTRLSQWPSQGVVSRGELRVGRKQG